MAVGAAPSVDGGRSSGVFRVAIGAGGLTALPLGPRSAGAQFLEDVREGRDVDWSNSHVAPDQADRVLAALGLLHMRVKCAIFDPDNEYDTKVSGASNRRRGEELGLTCAFVLYLIPDALVGYGRDGG